MAWTIAASPGWCLHFGLREGVEVTVGRESGLNMIVCVLVSCICILLPSPWAWVALAPYLRMHRILGHMERCLVAEVSLPSATTARATLYAVLRYWDYIERKTCQKKNDFVPSQSRHPNLIIASQGMHRCPIQAPTPDLSNPQQRLRQPLALPPLCSDAL